MNMKKEQILELGFVERDKGCYVLRGDVGNLDLQVGDNIIMIGSMEEHVEDIEHLKKIVDKWNDLWQMIVYNY